MTQPTRTARFRPYLIAFALYFALAAPVGAQTPAPLPTARDVFAPAIEIRPVEPVQPNDDRTWSWSFVAEDGISLCQIVIGTCVPLPVVEGVSFEGQVAGGGRTRRFAASSPDERFLVFSGSVSLPDGTPDYPNNDVLYLYDSAEEAFRRLGTVPYIDRPAPAAWLGTQVFLPLVDGINSQAEKRIYVADVMRADSLELLFEPHGEIDFYDDPPRYESLAQIGGGGILCGKQVYDLSTRQAVVYNYGRHLCRPDIGMFEGFGYFRNVPFAGEARNTATVVRIDGRTGLRRVLWTGEVEHVSWVSADEAVGILLIDNNGNISDFPTNSDDKQGQMGVPVSALADFSTGTVLASSVMYPYVRSTMFFTSMTPWAWRESYGIHALPDGDFVDFYCDPGVCGYDDQGYYRTTWDLFGGPDYDGLPQQKLDRLTLVDGDIVRTHLHDAAIALTPNKSGVFVWTQANGGFPRDAVAQGIGIYDFGTGEVYPLTREFDQDKYSFSISVRDERSATVGLSRADGTGQSYTVVFGMDGQPYVEIADVQP